ncbi:tRNA (cytidine(34)-2'-O)-methyltransferase [Mesorhizobium sp. RP14(2022)]|uniref:tRNA (cytidine(34)-2'-O)-methyltransferase n=1 Tax=Mesorhizobium liriopis TaxID=2953882 RepID=A0ABT1C4V6_9HYPH|nr:tRNA (cytidine(34)-2'-O)-methyltransferase [Mesorhizobium liriopis]MCO6049844.1 tRNA (cytidine(34)-2'-O)-methyltransferase [Mesorhizobium liriopis]
MAFDFRLALFQPDIAGNTGTILRLAACLGVAVDVIEPAGFDLSDRNLKRAGMDYLAMAALRRHLEWTAFEAWRKAENRRLVLFTTKADVGYTDLAFAPDDILLFGRESAGVPDHVHDAADIRATIPMPGGGRSLNLALSVAMGAGEAMRQVGRQHEAGAQKADTQSP